MKRSDTVTVTTTPTPPSEGRFIVFVHSLNPVIDAESLDDALAQFISSPERLRLTIVDRSNGDIRQAGLGGVVEGEQHKLAETQARFEAHAAAKRGAKEKEFLEQLELALNRRDDEPGH